MSSKLWWLMMVFSLNEAGGMLCYNCTSAHNERANCAGAFSPAPQPFYNDRDLLVNCTGDGALCFVRAWAARSRYAWMVQRGCYHPNKDDPVPRAMTVPTRAMACRHERFAEAEYKVCFCQSDWCNSTSVLRVQLVFVIIFSLFFMIR